MVPHNLHRARRPWAAALLSLLQPGLGHLYVGQPGRAVTWFVLSLLAGAIGAVLLATYALDAATWPATAAIVLGAYLWIAGDAARRAKLAPPDYALRRFNHWPIYVLFVIGAGLLAEVPRRLVRAGVVEAFRVPSVSMEPTFLLGDFVFVSKSRAGIAKAGRGAVVVFHSVEEPGVLVMKRIVGLPGDTLGMLDGVLRRDGAPVTEPYVLRDDTASDSADPMMRRSQLPYWVGSQGDQYRPSLENWGPLVVPSDSVMVLGDNRHDSYDSRYFGPVGRNRLIGRPTVIYYSYDKYGPAPLPFLTAIRWNRMGRHVEP